MRNKSKINVSRRVHADTQTVWRILADFGGMSKFNPFLSHSALLGEQSAPKTCGVGTHRQCDMKVAKLYLREKIVDWKEGASYTVHIYESMMPVNELFTTIGVVPDGAGRSEVHMRSEYVPKFGALGVIMDVLFLRMTMRFMFNRVLKGLERFAHRQENASKTE